MRDEIELYTDGACDPNPGRGSWAYVLLDKSTGIVLNEESGVDPETTSNRMEYTALIVGLTEILTKMKHVRKVTAYSDSMLLVDTFNKWMDGWHRKGWRRGKNSEVKNLDLVKKLHQLKNSNVEIEVKWVKGHSGIEYNERCDELCAEAIEMAFGCGSFDAEFGNENYFNLEDQDPMFRN